ncbi:DUF2004 domain-containing protein [Myroides odoratus]|uniref:DUF2004 domain-containing protein n=1 Tax=Myroides odoratus TaxID=256 RepID=A0A9Q6Z4B3_MYROD|nr:DUF2004 domain-containing protein [Myroides odoratus]EHQ43922.1 hypothetical protein Myrod_3104 [Myroides odoratus DSM 2801]EKB04961.1 hypothetical protein HMPREF9716_02992 [Myroides odoratus CIP 103059]QQU01224.1 DUF2004 domain-containing protein [Myroides odoratus]WQD56518.1 DUF2004 domain-containing protein [Myroides odoratus]STZ31198.1 Uncharacterised protein [Myroides odoratus]
MIFRPDPYKRIYASIFPTSEDYFISIDFTIGADLTQYVLMVNLTSDLAIYYITMES